MADKEVRKEMTWTDIEKELPVEDVPIVLCNTNSDGISEIYLCCFNHEYTPECGEIPVEEYYSIYDITRYDNLDFIIFDESDDGYYFDNRLKGKWMYVSEFEKLTNFKDTVKNENK